MKESLRKAASLEQRRSRMAMLLRRGYGIDRIAADLDLSEAEVQMDLAVMRRRMQKQQEMDMEVHRAEMIAMYQEIRAECWEAWERSKHNCLEKEEERAIRSRPGKTKGQFIESLKLVKQIFRKKGRLPSDRYLDKIMETLKAERELYGLDAPVEMNVNQNQQTFDWNSFLLMTSAGRRPDALQEKIDQLPPAPSHSPGKNLNGEQS